MNYSLSYNGHVVYIYNERGMHVRSSMMPSRVVSANASGTLGTVIIEGSSGRNQMVQINLPSGAIKSTILMP